MRKNIKKVLEAFIRGESAVGDSKNTCSTDGTTLWSYRMPIAKKLNSSLVEVVAYEAGPNRTTKSQIHACSYALETHFAVLRVPYIGYTASREKELEDVSSGVEFQSYLRSFGASTLTRRESRWHEAA